MHEMMEELRKEYEGLELSDEQIIIAKSNNLKPQNVKQIKEAAKAMNKIYDEIVAVMTRVVNSKEFEELKKLCLMMEKQNKEQNLRKKNKKGKELKPWEKKAFYNN